MNSNKNLVPAIDWPEWWRGDGHHFFEGTPFIGTHCKIIKHVRHYLTLRDQYLTKSVWVDAGYSFERCSFVSNKVGEIVKSYISWPNYFFLPEDRAALLFGVIPGVWFDAEDPVEEIRRYFHVKGLKDGESRYYDVVLYGKFKDCIDILLENYPHRI